MKVDAHIHFWQYEKEQQAWITREMKALRQDFLPEHLQTSLRRNGIDACIAVESSASELDTHFLVELARTHTMIQGVVGWVDLLAENLEERLAYFSQYPIIKGWRYRLEDREEGFLKDPRLRKGLSLLQANNYRFDLFVGPRQLKETIGLVADFPEMNFILDHAGKPDIRHRDLQSWSVLIRELAQAPNLNCKLSGLLTLAQWKDWSAAEFYPYLDVLFKHFGAQRLLFGSDWPILTLSGIYVQWISLLEKYMENFSAEEREAVMGGNAEREYGLRER